MALPTGGRVESGSLYLALKVLLKRRVSTSMERGFLESLLDDPDKSRPRSSNHVPSFAFKLPLEHD
jgi:hypothetical protein